jgi:hypothetical protein
LRRSQLKVCFKTITLRLKRKSAEKQVSTGVFFCD